MLFGDVINSSNYSSLGGVLFNKDKSILIIYPKARPNQSYIIPNSVITVEDNAFNNAYLTSITIGDKVSQMKFSNVGTHLKEYIVTNNNANYLSLDGVLFNKNKTELIAYPIDKISSNYIVPSSVTKISDSVKFSLNLSTLNLNNVTEIQESTIFGTYVKEFIVFATNPRYSTKNNVLFNKEQTSLIAYPMAAIKEYKPNGQGSSYIIPNGVTNISAYAFYPVANFLLPPFPDWEFYPLETLTIPVGVERIGACAIYGAKASAGVVLITTKSGSAATKGKAKISYNGRFGWTQNTTSTDFIRTGYDYVTFANKFYHAYNGVNMYLYEDEELQKLYDRRNDMTENPERPWVEIGEDGKYYYYGNTDWYGYFYNRTRPQMEHNVSITGGGEKVNYYISGRYYQQYGMFNIDKDLYKDYSFRAKMDAQLNKWIKWSTNIGLDNNNYNYNGTSNYAMTIARLESNISPSFVPFNPDGTIVQYTNQLYANSPLGAGDGGYLTSRRGHNSKSRTLLSVVNQIDITLLQGLTLTANYSYQQRKQLYRYRNNSFEYSRSQGVTQTFTSGSIFNNYEEDESFPVTHMLNYYATFEHSWAKKHNLKIVAGSQYETYRNVNKNTSMTNLSNDNLDSFSAVTPESVLTVSQDISAYKTLGFFGRINYDYMGKYLLEVSCRADGSSRFAEGDRWGVFPSVSAGWRISEENFFKPVSDWWSSLKLRASVGSLGNQQVDYYAYLQTITSDNQFSYTFDGEGKAYYAKISNPISSGLTWETVTTYNVGLDMSFLRNRLSMSADYYVRKTTDMLTTSLTLPDVYGASTPKANCADLRTNGWELSVSWNDSFKVANKPFRYGIQATLGDYQRTITKYNNPDKLISDHYVGKKMGEIWGYHVDGLFKTDKEAAEYQAKINDKVVNGRVYSSKVDGYLRAGDVRFADLNGDNVIGAGAGTVNTTTYSGNTGICCKTVRI